MVYAGLRPLDQIRLCIVSEQRSVSMVSPLSLRHDNKLEHGENSDGLIRCPRYGWLLISVLQRIFACVSVIEQRIQNALDCRYQRMSTVHAQTIPALYRSYPNREGVSSSFDFRFDG